MIEEMSLQDVQALSGGELAGANVRFAQVSTDTRTLQPGSLFVAISGENFNGNRFVEKAAEKGAVAAVTTEKMKQPIPVLRVENSRLTLGKLGMRNRELSKARIAALTGSQGKTTVKEMIAAILENCGKVLKTRGNLNNDLGVPLTLLELEAEHEYAVVELGANAPGEIAYTSAFVKPHVVHITNVAATHLEGFGDLDGVNRSKSEIWKSLTEGGVAVINLDDAYAGDWLEQLKGKNFVTVSALGKTTADYQVADLKFDAVMHSSFSLLTPESSLQVKLPLPGQHNVANAAAAAAISMQLGASPEAVRQGLESMQSVPGRMCLANGRNKSVIIDDSYNASPSSFRAAIDVLAGQLGTKIVAMGDMGELGNSAEEAHREIGTYAAEKGIEFFFAVGPLSDFAVKGFGKAGRHFTDIEKLAEHLLPLLKPEMTILVKGSRSSGMDRLVRHLTQEGD
ncbi:MAG: UDP-N-acetylmuramoyl-tripeptide--D-alanyl-D-alanine ligase [Gammaproteobacteria bacterium]|nr:UDP-N-acetylmuramoyl-tripeptide--D-alanyl-D-alanine ligase [Gammaproteobacteria bacterium]